MSAPISEVALPAGWSPYAVTGDATGTLWMTILSPPGIARLRPGETEVAPASLLPSEGRPMLLTVAADGALWCSHSDDRLSRPDGSGGRSVIELPPGSAPYGIAAASDGDVWFSAPGVNQIGRVTDAGDLTMIDLPVPEARAAMVAVDAEDRPWVALNGVGALACVADDGVRLVELPGGRAPAAPVGVAASTTGIWYADIAGGCVGRVDATGSIEQITFDDPACRPHAVAADPDGGCWVTLWGSGELARIGADGRVTRHRLPGREPHGLRVGDSRVWVAMESGSLAVVERDGPA
jgi:virginiamycin B lyase